MTQVGVCIHSPLAQLDGNLFLVLLVDARGQVNRARSAIANLAHNHRGQNLNCNESRSMRGLAIAEG